MIKLLFILIMFPMLLIIGCSSVNDFVDTGKTDDPDETEESIGSSSNLPQETLHDPNSEDKTEFENDADNNKTDDIDDAEKEPENGADLIPPPSFGFIDAHADTISRALLRDPDERGLYINNSLDVDFSRLSEFDAPVQIFALWLSDRFVSTGFEQINIMIDFFEQEVAAHIELIEIAFDLDDIRRIAGEGKISAVLAIEGGEALMGRIENLDHFYDRGVRVFAPTWNRENELGFGQAAGSSRGLKAFGIDVIKRMDELGMILDVSHLNEAGFWDAHNTSTRPYMASHSNAYSIMPHNRNLKDDQIAAIVESGGLIGFNMFPSIIAPGNRVTLDDVLAHFKHFIDIGAGDHIGLGCDLDGIPSMPTGFTDVSSIKMFGELLSEEFSEDHAYKIMEGNFYEFLKRYFEG